MSLSVRWWGPVAPFYTVAIFLFFFFVSRPALAVPDISGTFSGQLSGSETCENPDNSGPISVNVTLTFSQSGNSFTATGTAVESEGGTAELKLKGGTINDNGSFTAALEGTTTDNGDQLSGNATGTLSDNSLSLNFGYSLSGSDFCSGSLQGSMTRTDGDVIVNPGETPSSTITNTILNTIQVQSVTSDLSSRTGNVLRGRGSGIRRTASGLMFESISGRNAGDELVSFGLWSSYSYSDFDNDLSSTALDGSRHSVLAGIDFSPWEETLFGLAVGYENSDVDTRFNNGNQQSDGFTVAPYFGALISDIWSVDGSVGYSRVTVDQYRTDPATGARITSSPSSDRWFATFNINAFKAYRQWLFGGQIGYLWTRNTQGSFTESNGVNRGEVINRLGQWHVTGDVAYSLGQFEPFARVTYERDFSMTEITVVGGGPQPSNDRDDVLLGLGVRYFSTAGFSGNLEWNKRLGRDNFDEDMLMMTIRGEF